MIATECTRVYCVASERRRRSARHARPAGPSASGAGPTVLVLIELRLRILLLTSAN